MFNDKNNNNSWFNIKNNEATVLESSIQIFAYRHIFFRNFQQIIILYLAILVPRLIIIPFMPLIVFGLNNTFQTWTFANYKLCKP
jgi:hypothetical protein